MPRLRTVSDADLGLAVALAAYAQAEVWSGVVEGPRRAAAVTAAAITLPLALRRLAPLLGAAGVFLGLLARALTDVPMSEGLTPILAAVVALYSVGTYLDRRRAVAGLAGALAVMTLSMALDAQQPLSDLPFISLFLVLPWAAGVVLRERRLEAVSLAERAAELERSREAALEEERRRIARELHDVVAHSVSVMVVQAQAAQRVLGGEERSAREALEGIETSGRQALTEMRRLLTLLKGGEDEPSLAPQPRLRDLDGLARQLRDAGVPVAVRVEGAERDLPPGVDLAAYRVVQESLTNVLKHAGPAHADVVVRYGGSAIELEITDDGRGSNGTVGGHGIAGMRERLSLYGGELEAGPRAGGGFAVRARLPL